MSIASFLRGPGVPARSERGFRRLAFAVLVTGGLALTASTATAVDEMPRWITQDYEWPVEHVIAYHHRYLRSNPVRTRFEWHPSRRENIVIGQDPLGGALRPGQVVTIVVNQAPMSLRTVTVPALVGQAAATARRTLRDLGLVVDMRGEGLTGEPGIVPVVRLQSPEAGMRVRPGARVYIETRREEVGTSRVGDDRRVPNVVGRVRAEAERTLRAAGFELAPPNISGTGEGNLIVASQSPTAETSVRRGSRVLLFLRHERPTEPTVIRVGRPPPAEMATVPSVVGHHHTDAGVAVRNAGFQPIFLALGSGHHTVVRQEPGGGTRAARGSQVRLTLTAGSETVSVPNVVGRSRADATRIVTSSGLRVSWASRHPEGFVSRQSPAAGTIVRRGANVTLTGPVPAVPPGKGGR